MKRYALFGGDTYYPDGGWDDFMKDFDSPEEARAWYATLPRLDWFQIVDLHEGKQV